MWKDSAREHAVAAGCLGGETHELVGFGYLWDVHDSVQVTVRVVGVHRIGSRHPGKRLAQDAEAMPHLECGQACGFHEFREGQPAEACLLQGIKNSPSQKIGALTRGHDLS